MSKDNQKRARTFLVIFICFGIFSPTAMAVIPKSYQEQQVIDDAPPIKPLVQIEFINRTEGWLVGGIGMFKTIDGGKTWSQIGPALAVVEGIDLFSLKMLTPILWLDFINEKIGLVQRKDGLLRTADGGQHWELLLIREPTASQTFSNFSFFDEKSGWALSQDGAVYHSGDLGNSWTQQARLPGSAIVKAVSPGECWVLGREGRIWHTLDGGRVWLALSIDTTENLLDLATINGREVLVITSKAAYRSKDEGRTWSILLRAKSDDYGFRSIGFADSVNGWIIGEKGIILHTKNGGKAWSSQGSRLEEYLKRIAIVDESTAWIIGDAVLLNTTDGGNNWVKQKLPK